MVKIAWRKRDRYSDVKREDIMMEIQTARFGNQVADPEKTIYFPQGIAGFEGCTKFQLFHEAHKNHVVYYLQSLDRIDLMLNTAQPEVFGFQYDLTLSEEYLSLLDTPMTDPLTTLVVISRDPESEKIIPHPDCPIVVNTENRRAIQIKAGEILLNEAMGARAAA